VSNDGPQNPRSFICHEQDLGTREMKIAHLTPQQDWTLMITSDDGRIGVFDVAPFLHYEAFQELNVVSEFMKVSNGSYFVEWNCGADLSADTIESHWKVTGDTPRLQTGFGNETRNQS
jgi:hypothetical protein